MKKNLNQYLENQSNTHTHTHTYTHINTKKISLNKHNKQT